LNEVCRSLLNRTAGFVNGSIGDRISSMLSNFEDMILLRRGNLIARKDFPHLL
jgi:hypothetical protein